MGSDERTATICKQCPVDTTPSCKSVYRAANAFYASTKSEANSIRDTDMQNEVNNDPSMYCQGDGGGNVPNQEQTGYFTKVCPEGYYGSEHPYTVPTNRYFAATVTEANTLALNDIQANGQNYVNNLSTATCTSSGGGGCITPSLCNNAINVNNNGFNRYVGDSVSVNLSLGCVTGNNLTYVWKVNGSTISTSSSFNHSFSFVSQYPDKYNQAHTVEVTISNGCGSSTRTANIYLYREYNERQSGIFYKNDCTQGTGNPYEHSVAAGTYMGSTVSEANSLALAFVNSSGQNMANAYGTCTYTPPPPPITVGFDAYKIYRDPGSTFVSETTKVLFRNTNNFSVSVFVILRLNTGGTKTCAFIAPANEANWVDRILEYWYAGVCGSTDNYFMVSKTSDPSVFVDGYLTHQAC